MEQMTVSINGVFSTIMNQSGYSIEADCTGVQTDTNGNPVAKLTMVHGNDEVLGISVIPGSNLAVHFERIPSACSNAMLNGQYGFQRNGQTNGGPLLAIGTITFDGRGNSEFQQTTIRNGVVMSVSGAGFKYSLNPNCTGNQIDPTGSVFSAIVAVHNADEVLGMSMTPGNNVVIHYERTK